ncbi:MAG: DUF4270 family protein [Chitinophagales bacterium]
MNRNSKVGTYGLGLIWTVMTCCLVWSCSEPSVIGTNLLEDNEYINSIVTDTLSVKINALKTDSVETAPIARVVENTVVGDYWLGALNDQNFGKNTAGIYTQFGLPFSELSLGQPQTDSLVLSLAYRDDVAIYGDPNATHDIRVYRLNEPLEFQATYYSNEQFEVQPTLIGEKLGVKFDSSKEVQIQSWTKASDGVTDSFFIDTIAPHIRIPLIFALEEEFGEQDANGAFDNDSTFREFFNGIYVEVDGVGNSMASMAILDVSTNITLFYTNQNEYQSVKFAPAGAFNSSGYYSRDVEGTTVGQFLGGNPAEEQEQVYLSGLEGIGFSLEFPNLADLGDIVINRAELQMMLVPDSDTLYSAPTRFNYYLTNTDADLELTEAERSQILEVSETKRVVLESGEEVTRYDIDLTLFVQDLIEGRFTDLRNEVYIAARSINPNRVIIGGPAHPQYPMKLNLLYSVKE